jgi:hypothetical protein
VVRRWAGRDESGEIVGVFSVETGTRVHAAKNNDQRPEPG